MENHPKKRNIVNNMRWLYIDIAKKASSSMRLWKADRKCMRKKLELGGKYLDMVMSYNTMWKEPLAIAKCTLPSDYDPTADNVRLTLGNTVLDCAPGTVTTLHAAFVNIWNQAQDTLQYDAEIELEGDELYIFSYDSGLLFADMAFTTNGTTQATIEDLTHTVTDFIEQWNQLELDEIYVLPKEMVKLRERKPKCSQYL